MNEISKKRKKEKKRLKGLFNSYPLICGSISIGVRVLVLFDVTLVKCWLLHSFHGFLALHCQNICPPLSLIYKPTLQLIKRPLDYLMHIAF